ncbi:MAG: CheR family methyltransferase [Myxococcales bacterium]
MMLARAQKGPRGLVATRLVSLVARWTGFDEQAVREEALQAALAPLLAKGESPEAILERAAAGDRALVDLLSQAVLVGESYFFRQPEHFQFVASSLVPAWAADGRLVRAWCAGCSTGEEAYSLSAVLDAAGLRRFQVLGTDLLPRNVEHAREGRYGSWSLRRGNPLLADLFEPGTSGRDERRVRPELREHTEFRVHNLLASPPEPGAFDLVFCRNVLIYFAPAPAEQVRASLAGALLPGGVLAFAAMDVGATAPPGVERCGSPEHQIFVRADGADTVPAPPKRLPKPRALRRRSSAARSSAGEVLPPPPPASTGGATSADSGDSAESRARGAVDPVALHVRALGQLEQGERDAAERQLSELRDIAPGYVPALLESALLYARDGRKSAAVALMREVLERTLILPGQTSIDGPEPLPADFYASAARAFLDAEQKK